jgi:hypothetical protein
MSVPVPKTASLVSRLPLHGAGRFFHVDFAGAIGGGRTYDVSPDAQRFLTIKDRTDTRRPRRQ